MSHPGPTDALRELLAGLAERIPPERIDRVWLFAPREIGGKESGLVVLTLLDAAEPASPQRQLVTVRYEAERARGTVRRTDSLAEQGWAPAERIPRLMDGVLARLGDEREQPLAEEIAGDPARWAELLVRVGARSG